MKHVLKSYCRDTKGNFAIMFSVVVGLLVFAVAVAIETTRMYSAYGDLQDIADSSALSGAYVALRDPLNREKAVRDNIRFHEKYIPDIGLAEKAVVDFDDEAKILEVAVEIPRSLNSFFGGIIGSDTLSVSAKSVVSYRNESDPLSLAFALDVSGSMGYKTDTGAVKLDVLKQSTKLLFKELEEASDQPELLDQAIRTGMSAYNTNVVNTEEMHWGWDHLERAVDRLSSGGGTNSTPALKNAYDQLKFDRSFRVLDNPNFNIDFLREYVIFMTDGDNNEIVWDAESQALCKTMRADGVEIYTIGFTAPEKGQLLLLDCASWDAGKEPVDDSEYEDGPNGENDDDYDIEVDAKGKKKKKCKKAKGKNGKGKGKAKGKGKKKGRCKKEEEKENYFFDAADAEAFKEAFASIGTEIAKETIRIKR